MARGPTWTPEEDNYLRCPIPAAYLAHGALRHRNAESIRIRRRRLELYRFYFPKCFATLPGQGLAQRRVELSDFPGVNWDQTIKKLEAETGLCNSTVARLRREAGVKGRKRGPRKMTRADFPGVDWSRGPADLARELGVSIYIVRYLKNEPPGET